MRAQQKYCSGMEGDSEEFPKTQILFTFRTLLLSHARLLHTRISLSRWVEGRPSDKTKLCSKQSP